MNFRREGDGWILEEASYEDLDKKKVEDYIRKIENTFKEEKKVSSQQFLKDIGVLREIAGKLVPTAGGMLMFGKDPQRFLISSGVRVVRFEGKDMGSNIVDQKEIRGTISAMIEEAIQFIEKHMGKEKTKGDLKKEDISEYPLEAVREVIINAIIHRDYTIEGSPVRIFMFDNRIEVYTPGGLAKGVTIDNIEYTQHSRNKVITDILMHTGHYIDKLGRGIRRIKLALKEKGLKEPEFFDTGIDFVVTIFGPID